MRLFIGKVFLFILIVVSIYGCSSSSNLTSSTATVSQSLSLAANRRPVLILSAMQSESTPILELSSLLRASSYHGIPYYYGQLNGRPVIIARTGVGQVAAGIVTSLFVTHFHPRFVVFSGVAGGLQKYLQVGDVVIATQIFDVNLGQFTKHGPTFRTGLLSAPIGNKFLPLVYHIDPDLLDKITTALKNNPVSVYYASVATDQHFPNNAEVDDILMHQGVAAVDMEDNGVATACWLYHTPFVAVRAISDNIETGIPFNQKNAKKAAKNAALIVKTILPISC